MKEVASRPRGTDQESLEEPSEAQLPKPGLIAIFSKGMPQWMLIPILDRGEDGAPDEIELGRDNIGNQMDDARISRQHVRVRYENGTFFATDLGSLNGTFVDGLQVPPQLTKPLRRCLRIGDTLLLPAADLNLLRTARPTVHDGLIIGPRLLHLYQRIGRIAATSLTLHITGESGAGKENAARVFHRAGPASRGPFVAVNCATIPEGIAESVLFGARRGAFSGAVADSDGYIQAAHQGTLFLDEVAELQASVQAKLLRVLETREVLAVGAVRPQSVNLRICSASHRSLSAEVTAGRLREDLYYRIGRPAECIPALRERPEEIPWLIQSALQNVHSERSVHVSLVETCLLRHWPGNVRELLVEIRAAAQEAVATGSVRIKAEHLARTAGHDLKAQSQPMSPLSLSETSTEPSSPSTQRKSEPSTVSPMKESAMILSRSQIITVLIDVKGNVSEAARRLGMHRNQLRRQIEQHRIDAKRLRQITK